MAYSNGPKIVTNGLVLCLDAAYKKSYPGTGTAWYDSSGNNNHGTLTNGPSFDGNNGGSIVFDGTNDYVNLGSNFSLTGDITFESWIKTSNPNKAQHIIGSYNNTGYPWNGWGVGISIPNFTKLAWWSGTSWKNSDITFNLNEWKSITISFKNNVAYFYENGEYFEMISSDPISLYTGNKFLGGRANDGASAFRGEISNSKIYNRALSAAEIQQNYNVTKGRYGL